MPGQVGKYVIQLVVAGTAPGTAVGDQLLAVILAEGQIEVPGKYPHPLLLPVEISAYYY